jgi:hypothetical protein
MKIASSTIRDIHDLLWRRVPLLGGNDGGERLSFSRYSPSDLALSDQSWTFSHGHREEYCPCNIFPSCYVFGNGVRTLSTPVMSTWLSSYFSLAYWCGYSCQWWLTTSMVAHVHVALALRLKIKLWENLCWIFGSMVWYLSSTASTKIQDCVKKEEGIWRSQSFASFFRTLLCNN